MEVVRDRADNAIIICSIENVDPMGVHTGDSITVAPALTLTDKEYQIMRNASIAVLREIGVETGGSNVQFAVNPKDGRLIVIEMNPRVSRSLGAGVQGDRLPDRQGRREAGGGLHARRDHQRHHRRDAGERSSRRSTMSSPRSRASPSRSSRAPKPLLGTAMKSVGEVMAIGRNIHESMQKALRGLETGLSGFNQVDHLVGAQQATRSWPRSARPTPDRLLIAAQALREGFSVEEIHADRQVRPLVPRSGIDEIVAAEREVIGGRPAARCRRHAPPQGDGLFRQAARLAGAAVGAICPPAWRARSGAASGLIREAVKAMTGGVTEAEVRAHRHKLGVRPVFKRIDTCAAEFEAKTPYMYSTYEAPTFGEPENEACPCDRKKVVILGGGPNRIGQGIEFDYCCCHACFALRRGRLRDDHGQLQPGDGVAPTMTRPTASISSR